MAVPEFLPSSGQLKFVQTLTFWPSDTKTWYDFLLNMFFETEGVLGLCIISLTLFAVYRLSGSPLDVSAEANQVDREEQWAAHNERFKPVHHPKWVRSGPAGDNVNSWNGTGDGAAIRKDAVLGDKVLLGRMPNKREDVLIATHDDDDEETVVITKEGKKVNVPVGKMVASSSSSGGGGGKASSSKKLAADGMAQQDNRENKVTDALRFARENNCSPPMKNVVVDGNTSVCIVGDPKSSSVSIITVHDIATNYRSGLLQLSVEMLALIKMEARDSGLRVKDACFYHIAMPGHDLVGGVGGGNDDKKNEDEEGEGDGIEQFNMDALAGRVNKAIKVRTKCSAILAKPQNTR
jgi:hypothetical protein